MDVLEVTLQVHDHLLRHFFLLVLCSFSLQLLQESLNTFELVILLDIELNLVAFAGLPHTHEHA